MTKKDGGYGQPSEVNPLSKVGSGGLLRREWAMHGMWNASRSGAGSDWLGQSGKRQDLASLLLEETTSDTGRTQPRHCCPGSARVRLPPLCGNEPCDSRPSVFELLRLSNLRASRIQWQSREPSGRPTLPTPWFAAQSAQSSVEQASQTTVERGSDQGTCIISKFPPTKSLRKNLQLASPVAVPGLVSGITSSVDHIHVVELATRAG